MLPRGPLVLRAIGAEIMDQYIEALYRYVLANKIPLATVHILLSGIDGQKDWEKYIVADLKAARVELCKKLPFST